jgi:hypothetical protein
LIDSALLLLRTPVRPPGTIPFVTGAALVVELGVVDVVDAVGVVGVLEAVGVVGVLVRDMPPPAVVPNWALR